MRTEVLYLSRRDVEAVGLDMATIIDRLEQAFREKGEGRVEVPPKPGIHPVKDAFIHAMPAYIPAMRAAGIKWVSGYPENYRRNLPYINALIILNDPETGLPIAVMDGTWITAKRTAAATALAARYLARPDSRTLGILGCGVQGRAHIEALRALFPIERVYAYDIRPEVQAAYVEEMRAQHGIEVVGVSTPRQAVEASDIVVTVWPMDRGPAFPARQHRKGLPLRFPDSSLPAGCQLTRRAMSVRMGESTASRMSHADLRIPLSTLWGRVRAVAPDGSRR